MTVTQVYNFVNEATKEVLGQEALVEENLQNIVQVGADIANVEGTDNFVRALTDRIGKTVFEDRIYRGRVPSLYKDGWEFGSILQKISCELPEASEDEAWELTNNATYEENRFYKPTVIAKYWNKKVSFQIPISYTEMQVKSAFTSPTEMSAFVSMLFNTVDRSMQIKMDSLVMRCLNNMIGETVYDDFGTDTLSSKSGVKAVNLLYLYNNGPNYGGTTLTAAKCLTDEKFLRFAAFTIKNYRERLRIVSKLFNISEKDRFSDLETQHTVLLSEFENAAGVYLYNANGQFLINNLELPAAETVPYWQGSGTDYAFTSTGKVDVITSENHNIAVTGVLGVIFDDWACAVTNDEPRVKTKYNNPGEFFNQWYKRTAQLVNAFDENFVVFFVA